MLALLPIQDDIELGNTLPRLVTKLASADFYPPLFEAAFGTPEINSDRIAKALAQFVRPLISYSSTFDRVDNPPAGGIRLDEWLHPDCAAVNVWSRNAPPI